MEESQSKLKPIWCGAEQSKSIKNDTIALNTGG